MFLKSKRSMRRLLPRIFGTPALVAASTSPIFLSQRFAANSVGGSKKDGGDEAIDFDDDMFWMMDEMFDEGSGDVIDYVPPSEAKILSGEKK